MSPDYSLPLNLPLVFGQGSSGKTTFCFRYLINAPGVSCRFIFDDRGQAAQVLKIRACNTAAECEAALATRWVILNPHSMFPGARLKDGFRWFCHWASQASRRGPGRKILFVDEMWQWCDSRREPPDELQSVIRTDRVYGLELISATHRPREYHSDIRSLVTEWVGFNTIQESDLKEIRCYWPGVDAVRSLPKFSFLAYNRESGAELSGRLS